MLDESYPSSVVCRPSSGALWSEFQSLCSYGGRLAGSASEAQAIAFARHQLVAVPGARVREEHVDYPGWRCRNAQLTHAVTGVALPCTPLLRR